MALVKVFQHEGRAPRCDECREGVKAIKGGEGAFSAETLVNCCCDAAVRAAAKPAPAAAAAEPAAVPAADPVMRATLEWMAQQRK